MNANADPICEDVTTLNINDGLIIAVIGIYYHHIWNIPDAQMSFHLQVLIFSCGIMNNVRRIRWKVRVW